MSTLQSRNSLFFLVAFLFLASSCNPLKKYADSVTVWEKDIAAFETLDKSENDPEDAVLFTGSSSIRLWSSIKEDIAPYKPIRRGFGGAKYSDMAWYAERIIHPHQYKALVVLVGNDISGSPKDKSPEEIIRLVKYIVKVSQKHAPGKPVFFIEVTPTPARWSIWSKIKHANDALEKYIDSQKNIYFIKTSSCFLTEKGEIRNEFFMPDGLHLNSNGYSVWSNAIKDKLNSVLK